MVPLILRSILLKVLSNQLTSLSNLTFSQGFWLFSFLLYTFNFAIPLSSRHEKCCQMLDFFGYFNALETRNLGIEKENHRSNLMSLWIYYNLEFLFFCEIVWAEQDKPQIISFLFFLFARRKSNRATMS